MPGEAKSCEDCPVWGALSLNRNRGHRKGGLYFSDRHSGVSGLFVTTKTANGKNFVNPAHGDIPTVKSNTSHREDPYDDKVEEI